MRTTNRFGTIVITALAALLLGAPDASAQIGLPLGETPGLPEIEDLDGNPVSLADFVGDKPVLIEFWAYWCEQCEELHPQLAQAYADYGDRMNFVAVGVGVNQTPRRIRRHMERMDPPVEWPVLFDRRGAATRAFNALTTAYIYILDRMGRVVYVDVGPDQDIEAAIRAALGAPTGN